QSLESLNKRLMIQPPMARRSANGNQSARQAKMFKPLEFPRLRLHLLGGIADRERQFEQIWSSPCILWGRDLEVKILQLVSWVADVHQFRPASRSFPDITGDRHASVPDAEDEIGPGRLNHVPRLAIDNGETAS